MSILILECMPKGDKVREGEILKKFLTLPGEDDGIDVKLKEFANKHDFLKFLNKRSNLDYYDFVHLSGHGSIEGADAAFFDLPKGSVQPFEFPEDVFEDLNVALSAWSWGRLPLWILLLNKQVRLPFLVLLKRFPSGMLVSSGSTIILSYFIKIIDPRPHIKKQ